MKYLLLFVMSLAACNSAIAAQAFFTGRQEMVQSVTYQMVWRCEYNYAGRTFWKVFKSGCPSNIEIE